jgi:hypothetical protein
MIEVTLNSCWTIVFLNKSHNKPTPTVWVCTNHDAWTRGIQMLEKMKHIEIIQQGASHVKS